MVPIVHRTSLIGDRATTDMEIVTSSIDKKRFRLPLRYGSTSGGLVPSDVVPNTTTTEGRRSQQRQHPPRSNAGCCGSNGK